VDTQKALLSSLGPVLSLSSFELTLTNDRLRAENDGLSLSALLDITNPSATLMTKTTQPDSFPPVILTNFAPLSPSAPLLALPPHFSGISRRESKSVCLFVCLYFLFSSFFSL
jgi:hypothetical protein